jgi:hypothetical protein
MAVVPGRQQVARHRYSLGNSPSSGDSAVQANVKPGQQFRVMISQEVMVTCPRGVRPGQRAAQLPPSKKGPTGSPQPPDSEACLMEIRADSPFALIANGQRWLTSPSTCDRQKTVSRLSS